MKIFILACIIGFQGLTASTQSNLSPDDAVRRFLITLNADELKKTSFLFEDSLRQKWTNLPVGLVPRPGIQYGSLSDESRLAFHRVLSSLLSSQGYLKLTSIMQLDDILNVLYKEALDQGRINQETFSRILALKWGHGNYYISVWGRPQEKEAWGLSFGGHHIALSFTVRGDQVSLSPLFIGTDPSEVKSSKYAGWRILSKEEDYGFMLVNMLSEAQKSKAILKQQVPGDIITNPNSSQRISDYYGISAGEFNEAQGSMLEILIQEYIHNFEHAFAHGLYSRILKTGLNKIHFAWVGSLENNKPHYYIVHGPDFLIEYDNVGFQNDGNHIHAILRESGNDFGEDILKKHYLESKH